MIPAAPLTVAAAQATPVPAGIAANAITAARLARQAADSGAQLIVLPELFLCAYHPPAIRADPAAYITPGDARLDPLRTLTGIAVIVGAAVRHDDGRRTCSVLLAGNGEISVAYDKQNLWGQDENELFTPGTSGTTLTLGQWRLGLGICYDGCFPEHARAAAGDGAHAYLAPSGYLAGSQHRRDLYYRARALDNTMYVVFANNVGGHAPWTFNGGAAIHDPQGRTLAQAPDHGEAVIVATLDPAELAATRNAHTMLADRPTTQGTMRRQLAV